MQKRGFTLFIILLCMYSFTNAFGQDTLKKLFLKMNDLGLFAGTGSYDNNNLTAASYQKLTTDNTLLNNFKGKGGYNNFNADNTLFDFGVSTGLIFWNKKKQKYNDQVELRIGFLYNVNNFGVNTENGTQRSPCDTLISHTNPKIYYIDTVKQYNYSISRKEMNAGFFLQNTFHTRQNRVLSFYTGYGVKYMFGISNQLDVGVSYRESFEDQDKKKYYQYEKADNSYSLQEKTNLHNWNTLLLYVPVGLNVRPARLSRKTVYHLVFNPELTVGYKIQKTTAGNFNQAFFGIKMTAKYYFHTAKMKDTPYY